MKYVLRLTLILAMFITVSCSNHVNNNITEKPVLTIPVTHGSSTPLSAEESMKLMHLPEGYRVELVASEPMVQEPVAIAWDGNGRLYVAEMRTYMQDINGINENLPISRIVRLEDTDGDGKMDKRTIFIDSLILPRLILPLDDRLIVEETYSNNLYSYRDTNNDGVADEKIQVIHNDAIDKRNLEHQKSGLIWNLDNWIYATRQHRMKWNKDHLEADTTTEDLDGQWGLGNDNYGRLFLSSAGGEVAAFGFQQMPAYGELEFEKDQYEGDFDTPYPIITTPDIEGGQKRLKADSTLNHFTASCGQTIYRGDRLPATAEGDLFICEPVGRLIRRAKVMNKNGKRVVKNAYNKAEFLTSTDMNFRPVNTATGPDGVLYVVDMYRGIIQEGNWTGPKSYLRPQILRYGLEKNIGRGRIYRIVHDEIPIDKTKPDLLTASPDKLVSYLSHPNGWWRENAQKILIVKNDLSAMPALKKLALGESSDKLSQLGRIHALWTLEGLHAIDKSLLLTVMDDKNPVVRKMAIWLSEDYIKKNDSEVLSHLSKLINDPDVDVRIQLSQSLRYTTLEKSKPFLEAIIKTDTAHSGMLYQSAQVTIGFLATSLKVNVNTENLNDADKVLVLQGAINFKSLCSSCHGPDGKGLKFGNSGMIAQPLSGSARVNGDPNILIRIVLSGLTGPIDGNTYPSIMPAQMNSEDPWLAAVLSYVRTNLGNKAKPVHEEDIKKVRAIVGRRWDPWTLEELKTVK